MNNYELVVLAEKAAEEVDRGWTQNNYSDSCGNVCAVGGLLAAVGGRKQGTNIPKFDSMSSLWSYPEHSAPFSALIEKYRKVIGTEYDPFEDTYHQDIVIWNDTLGRTKEDVVDAWKMVAKDIANGETE